MNRKNLYKNHKIKDSLEELFLLKLDTLVKKQIQNIVDSELEDFKKRFAIPC